MTLTIITIIYIVFTIIANIWLVRWAYLNWKSTAQKSAKKMDEYNDLNQDEKDFWSIK